MIFSVLNLAKIVPQGEGKHLEREEEVILSYVEIWNRFEVKSELTEKIVVGGKE